MEKVVVLMSTYNGEKYLRTQIESLLGQEDVEVEILARDDGSKDGTPEILESYRNCPAGGAENAGVDSVGRTVYDSKVTDCGKNSKTTDCGKDSKTTDCGKDSKTTDRGNDSRVTDCGNDSRVTDCGKDSKTTDRGSDSRLTDCGNDRNSRSGKVRFSYYIGENVGPAGSFLDLMKHAPEADYYALCDQDDTWLPDKLKIAVDAIRQRIVKSAETSNDVKLSEGAAGAPNDVKPSEGAAEGSNDAKPSVGAAGAPNDVKLSEEAAGNGSPDVPVLYYGMPRFADNDGNLLTGPKGIYEKSLDFPSCLIKSNSTGCTMVFNKKLLDIINSKMPGVITMHDEWLHKVCLALKGEVIYDEDVHILYRQHGNNTIGGQLSMKKVMRRYLKTLFSPDCIRSRCIETLLSCYGDVMPEENRKLAAEVAGYKKSLKARFRLLAEREIKTPYAKRNMMYKAAVLLGIF